MPQNTNLNIAPYYDDFNEDKNYYRVLFKPGKNVQARELTTLQSILQNQIEKFGKHFFKDGSMVIPGNIGYDDKFDCVEIESIHLGIPVGDYLNELVGKVIRGEKSRVKAKIQAVLSDSESERNNNTLYIKYKSSSQSNFVSKTFEDGENLIIQDDVTYSVGTIRANNTFATTISNNSTSTGSAVKISEGVYFIRGFFLTIAKQTLILDQYSNKPSYRVGLLVKETFAAASNEFIDLLDNSQGFYNFAAPGADRLLLETELFKKPLDDYDDVNFVQLLKIENGIIDSVVKNTDYNILLKELARRTYDESGDYYVNPFDVDVKESLNNYLGNNGIYEQGQLTKNGNTPSDSLACIAIGPGKAYVRGYEIENTSNTIIDFDKARDTDTAVNQNIQFNFGKQIQLNNVNGYIPIGFTTSSYIQLYDRRTDTVGLSSGTQIGVARLYDLKLNSSSIGISTNLVFDASLFDIQTYTKLNISSGFSTSYNKSTYIKGKTSGANGFLVSGITTTTTEFNLYQVSGDFIKNESLIINGIESNRVITDIRDYSLKDVYQITSSSNGITTNFTADTLLTTKFNRSNKGSSYTISNGSSGISTITTSNDNFYRNIRVGDVISYTKPNETLPTYNRVKTVNKNSSIVTIERVKSVAGVNVGDLPSSIITVNDLRQLTTDIIKKDSKLYTGLNNNFVSSIDLTSSSIKLRKTITIDEITNVQQFELSIFDGSSDSSLYPFDEEDYTLVYEDGVIETLTSQKLLPNIDSSNNPAQGKLTLRNLTSSALGKTAYLTISYEKVNCKTRNKIYNRCSSLIISRTNSISNENTITGLLYTPTYQYGRRVEDEVISLNVPEVTKIIGIYEAKGNRAPILPGITLSSINDSRNISDLIRGEKIIGTNSKTIGVVVVNDGISLVTICTLNNKTFDVGETIIFEESGIVATVGSVRIGDKNITDSYILDDGNRESYLDYSRIIRKENAEAPTGRIRIIYNHYTIDGVDTGSFVAVNSYNPDLYGQLPKVNTSRYSDILDFRPRVTPFNTSSQLSPFDFESRIFSPDTSSSPSVVARDSFIVLSYDYYLPRIDKLFLNKNGEFNLVKGTSALNPKEPSNLSFSLEIAKFDIPAYTNNVKDIKITKKSHNRYTMKDISKLEERIENIEYLTSLSLLEIDAKNLQIIDNNTLLNRFKTGFFVDDFSSDKTGDYNNNLFRAHIDTQNKLLTPEISKEHIDLKFDSASSENIKKVGNYAYLNFTNTEYLKNPFATRIENINPFDNSSWNGVITLNPSSDTWFEDRLINQVLMDTTVEDEGSNDVGISSDVRTRNIEILASALKPNTRFYAFFDNVDVTRFVVPKLIEIEMISGAFEIGEVISGYKVNDTLVEFKIQAPNHKAGPINSPTITYENNPYDVNNIIPSNYSSTSTILNVDTESLSSITDSDFYGNISKNMLLRGNTSKAVAKVRELRLISDDNGTFIGSLHIPYSQIQTNPKFKVGNKTFTLTTNLSNSNNLEDGDSYAEVNFEVAPTIENINSNTLTANITNNDNRNINGIKTSIRKVNKNFTSPLAQSFDVIDDTGIFLTKCDVFFNSKDLDNTPITLQIRTLINGYPSDDVIPLSDVTLTPSEIQTSDDATVATTFTFNSPIFLEGDAQYCIVLLTTSDDYSVWISRMGEEDVTSISVNDGNKNIVSQQPSLGSLFKSQNASTWEPSQLEDLKFILYRANFITQSGTVNFYNPSQSSSRNKNQIKQLRPNSIQSYNRSLLIELNKSLTSSDVNLLSSSDRLTQLNNSTFNARVDRTLGSISNTYTLLITNPGTGYTSGVKNYTNVDLVSLTGNGSGGRVTLGVGTGSAYVATVTNGGSNYAVGDVLTIDYKDTENLGQNVLLTIPNTTGIVTSITSIIVDEVQGATPNTSNDLVIGSTTLTGVRPAQTPEMLSDGLHLKINTKNHGLYPENSIVKISDVQSDILPTKLSSDITQLSTTLQVESSLDFVEFEGRVVGPSTIGYLVINQEIMAYSGVNTTSSPNTITINTNGRGIDNSTATLHYTDDLVFKYEFNNISLRKINKEHLLTDVNHSQYKTEIDSYHVKIASDNNKYFLKSKTGSRLLSSLGVNDGPRTTYNIPFSTLTPITNIITPPLTNVNAKCKTFTSKSVNGTEVPYLDKGYEEFSLTSENNFSSMRAIYHKLNEVEYINSYNNKSFNLRLDLSTSNSKVSPVIDLERVKVIAECNRINKPIEDYSKDPRVNDLISDPSAEIYISNKISLSKASDSLKVIFDAYRHETNDILVAYRVFRDDTPDEYQLYKLFPGYKNIDLDGNIIDSEKNTGFPDTFVPASSKIDDFRLYEYTTTTPFLFNGFQIKIIGIGTDQSNVPKIKNLRVIATR